jgi:hypothetical protein
MSSAGGRPSWQKMVSVGTSIVPPWHRPPPEGTPDTSSTVMTSQATASRHDFAVSLIAAPASLVFYYPLHPAASSRVEATPRSHVRAEILSALGE